MTPQDEQALAAAIKDAQGPLRITGGGTRPIGRPVEGTALSTRGLSGISLYDPGALTLVAQAGTPLTDIAAVLDAENQRLAFEPMDHRPLLGTKGTPTIGGVVAGNVSGPRRVAVGACRDFLLGVRLVDGTGRIIKNGGRVMKNVTGYDLVKLMCGAHGTLGVLTEVALKVLPKVETEATLVLDGLDDATGVKALSRGLASPFEVTGAAHADGKTYLRIEGFTASVAYRTEKLASHVATFGTAAVMDAKESAALWPALRDVTRLAATSGDIWRISTRPSQAAAVTAAIAPQAVQYDWGGGLIWAALPTGQDPRPALGGQGHATLVRATAETRAAIPSFQPEPAPLAAISAGLRAKFDPRGILNPGLMT